MNTNVFWLTSLIVAAWCVGAPAAHAQQYESQQHGSQQYESQAAHAVELGVNLRTDRGQHAVRVDVGYKRGRLGALLVVDPMVWTDGQTSTDLLVMWLRDGFQPFAGWRLDTVPLVDGSQLQHNLVLGAGLALPQFFGGRITGQWGVEVATMLVKHGGGLPSDTIGFASGRHYIDYVNFGMFARFDYNLGL